MDAPLSPGTGPEMILVRYGELALKGKNRSTFEHALVRNLRDAAANTSPVRIELSRGRIAVFPERRVSEVAVRLQDVFGVKSLSPAWGCEPTPEAIAELAEFVLRDTLAALPSGVERSFRVRTNRSDKSFPMTSTELDRYVAERALPSAEGLRVQLRDPELELGIEVQSKRAYVFMRRLPGPGGLPGGTLGRVMCLISGGIDSPVAAWLAMKRGARVFFVTYHSYPYIGDASKKKVVDLVRRLSRYQSRCRLLIVPFTEIQTAIRDSAPQPYRTVLYRRFMQRLASRLAVHERCKALLTGESLGQVASQTLENMTCIESAAELPVLRPLLTADKEEAIDLAKRIGTFDVSIQPEPDCCTVFMPKRPMIYGKVEDCEAAEAALDVEGLLSRALAGVERVDIQAEV